MKVASIDIGTNTLRLLIAEAEAGRDIRPIVYRRAITRLGGGFTEDRGISDDALKRTLEALSGFKAIIDMERVEEVHAVATSVVRRAVNRDAFLDEARRRFNIDIEVIGGEREAGLSFKGVLTVAGAMSARLLVMDIGGGSTEFAASLNGSLVSSFSLEMGVVHLTERHLKGDPPTRGELMAMEREIEDRILAIKDRLPFENAVLVGTAGTVTTLAAIDLGLSSYDAALVNRHVLTRDRIAGMYKEMSSLTLKERKDILSLEKGREDLIVAGSAIALKAMDAFGFEGLAVSDAGLLEGVLIDSLGHAWKGGFCYGS